MIHYIVVLYVGNGRRYQQASPQSYLLRHLDFIASSSLISRATVVLNSESYAQEQWVSEIIDSHPADVDFIVRPNLGFSYAGWADAIEANLDTNADYFMLMEDDYVPTGDEAFGVFIEKMNSGSNVGYVCSIISSDNGFPRHAGMSCGLLSVSAVRGTVSKGYEPLLVDGVMGYDEAEVDQVNFLRNLESAGYTYTDIADVSCVPFADRGRVIYYGNQERKIHIEPIFEEA